MKKLVKNTIILASLLIGCNAYAQPGTGQAEKPAPKVIPPSPEAANLGKFAEIPVSLYTGTPDINIPIHEITKGPLKLNVDFTYHASGIKVEEMASWVGIGWALNAGGIVTRTVRGKPDDNNGAGGGIGFLQYSVGKSMGAISAMTVAQKLVVYNEVADGMGDLEPDLYFINVNGITVQFTFDWNGQIVQSEEKNIKIAVIKNSSLRIIGWDVTDIQGTVYKFRDIETTTGDAPGSIGPLRNGTFASSWYLTQMVDVNNENPILFTYAPYSLDYGFKGSTTIRHGLSSASCYDFVGNIWQSNVRTVVDGKRISEIRTDDNSIKIKFIAATTNRTDTEQLWAGGINSNFTALDKIEITNSNNTEIKTLKVLTDYSTGRLTLKSVTPQRGGLNISPPYQLTYANQVLPSALSYAQDHWGYFNNKINIHLVPPMWISNSGGLLYVSGGDRTTDPAYSGAGSLVKLTYPTGGFTEFQYEPHEYGHYSGSQLAYYGKSNAVFEAVAVEQGVSGTFTTSTSFTINNDPANPGVPKPVTITYSVFTDAATNNFKPSVKLFDANNVQILSYSFGMQDPNGTQGSTEVRSLIPGNYRLEATCKRFGDVNDNVLIRASFEQVDQSTILKNKIAGGIRVKEIRNYSFAGDPNFSVRQFKYTMQNDPSRSSGAIHWEPQYSYDMLNYCPIYTAPVESTILVRISNNANMLGLTAGSHIGYREVETIFGMGSNLNGKSISKFTSLFDYNDVAIATLPFSIATPRSYKTGLLLEQTDFSYSAGSFFPVKKIENQYSFFEPYVEGLSIMYLGGGTTIEYYITSSFTSRMGKSKLIKKIETDYSSNNTTSTITTTDYLYDSFLSRQLKETKDVGNNTKYESNYFYAQDLVSPPQFVTDMITLNVVGVPLYTTQSKIVGSTPFFSGANKSEYTYSSGKLRMLRQTKFNATGSNAPTASFTDPNFSLAVQFDSYDNRGNLLQYTTADGVSSSYVWGYNAEYPIAEAKGATVGSIFHTSFEEDGTVGNAKTGNRSFIGTSYVIPVTKQPIGTNLVMSYWYFNGQWLFQPETTYSATITKSGATAYDEIRVYPASAQMATYTYEPQIGMTSTTDANNVTTYYEYDSFNRLKQVADKDKSIVKKLTYNYKN